MQALRIGLIARDVAADGYRRVIEDDSCFELVAVCPPQDAAVHDLLGRDDLSAVVIDGDRSVIPRFIIAALGHGLHVLSDQLPAVTLEDLMALRQAEREVPDVRLVLRASHHRHGSVEEAVRLAQTGSLGQLLTIRGVYGTAGRQHAEPSENIMMTHGAVMLDLMHAFAGPFEEIKAMLAPASDGLDSISDNVFALLRTHAGVMAFLHASATQWRQTFRLELGFEKGFIWLDGLNDPHIDTGPEMLITAHVETNANNRPFANPDELVKRFEPSDCLARDLQAFSSCIRGEGRMGLRTTTDAFDALNTIHRILAADPAFPEA